MPSTLELDHVAAEDLGGDDDASPPYPRKGTPEEKLAWAKADTARRTNQANAECDGEACWLDAPETPEPVKQDWAQAEREFAEDLRQMRLAVARHDLATRGRTCSRATPIAYARPRGPRRRSVRSSPRRARAPSGSQDDDPDPPSRDLAALPGFQAASARMLHHVGRRRAATRAA